MVVEIIELCNNRQRVLLAVNEKFKFVDCVNEDDADCEDCTETTDDSLVTLLGVREHEHHWTPINIENKCFLHEFVTAMTSLNCWRGSCLLILVHTNFKYFFLAYMR